MTAELGYSVGSSPPQMPAQISRFFQKLQNMRKDNKMCDAVLSVGDKSWNCHQLVLSAWCDVLYSALESSALKPGQAALIKLPDGIHVGGVEILLNFFYTGQLDINQTTANIVLPMANYLKLTHVKAKCNQYLQQGNGAFDQQNESDSFDQGIPIVESIPVSDVEGLTSKYTSVESAIGLDERHTSVANIIETPEILSRQHGIPMEAIEKQTIENNCPYNTRGTTFKQHHFNDFIYDDFAIGKDDDNADDYGKTDPTMLVEQNSKISNTMEGQCGSIQDGKNVSEFSNLTKVASDAYEDLRTENCAESSHQKEQLESAAPLSGTFRCEACSLLFSSRNQLTTHINSKHKQKKYGCSFCAKSFHRKADATLHECRMHMTKKPFACDTCDKTFALKKQLIAHKRVHTDGYAFKCAVCGKTFVSAEGHKHHLLSHRESTTMCGNAGCDSTFVSQNGLDDHDQACQFSATSSVVKTYQCGVCGDSFRWAHLLRRHNQSVHLKLKPFKCTECDRSFHREEHLRQHASTHSAKRDHKCDLCGKTFKQKSGLYVHKKVHSGDSKIVCDICGYNCHTNSALRVHQLTHSEERPYSCPKCDKTFKARKNLNRHASIHEQRREKKTNSVPSRKKSQLAPALSTSLPTSSITTLMSKQAITLADPLFSPMLASLQSDPSSTIYNVDCAASSYILSPTTLTNHTPTVSVDDRLAAYLNQAGDFDIGSTDYSTDTSHFSALNQQSSDKFLNSVIFDPEDQT